MLINSVKKSVVEYRQSVRPEEHDREAVKEFWFIIALMLVAFVLHLIWENVQASLYEGFQSFNGHFRTCFIGTLGDVMITALAYFMLRLLKSDIKSWGSYMAVGVMGFVIAVVIEQHALLTGRWAYTVAMPLIPWFHVGLTPILQMTSLLPLTLYVANLFHKKLYAHI